MNIAIIPHPFGIFIKPFLACLTFRGLTWERLEVKEWGSGGTRWGRRRGFLS